MLEPVHPEPVPSVVYIATAEEFRLFGVREKAVHLVLFAWGDSLTAILALLQPFATCVRKVVVVDVQRVPELGVQFGIVSPMLFKMYLQRGILAVFEGDFSSATLARFAAKTTHPRWRYTSIR